MIQVVAIIQARMGSTRLPGKVLKPILGKPMLERMLERVKQAKLLDTIVVATSTKKTDYPIVQLTNKLGILSFRGSETDVLDRYYQAAKKFQADIVVRLTADCPLIDPQLIDAVVTVLRNDHLDYASNRVPIPLVPSGFDAEALTFKTLTAIHSLAKSAYDREHVVPYIHTHLDKFKTKTPPLPKKPLHPNLHLSVDTQTDLDKIRKIYTQLYPVNSKFSFADVINLVSQS